MGQQLCAAPRRHLSMPDKAALNYAARSVLEVHEGVCDVLRRHRTCTGVKMVQYGDSERGMICCTLDSNAVSTFLALICETSAAG
eukprot:3140329-Rhodomonas_salina.6